MKRQTEQNPDLEVPKVLISLIDSIIRLEGQKTEGIFRIPGEAEGVSGK
jgi:hypothetical protein